nr:hypothetical protein [Endozoicomonas sp.]
MINSANGAIDPKPVSKQPGEQEKKTVGGARATQQSTVNAKIPHQTGNERKPLTRYRLTQQAGIPPIRNQEGLQENTFLFCLENCIKHPERLVDKLSADARTSLENDILSSRSVMETHLKRSGIIKAKSNIINHLIGLFLEGIDRTNKITFIESIFKFSLIQLRTTIITDCSILKSKHDLCVNDRITNKLITSIFHFISNKSSLKHQTTLKQALIDILSKANHYEVFLILHILSIVYFDWLNFSFLNVNFSLTKQQSQNSLKTTMALANLMTSKDINTPYLLNSLIHSFVFNSRHCEVNAENPPSTESVTNSLQRGSQGKDAYESPVLPVENEQSHHDGNTSDTLAEMTNRITTILFKCKTEQLASSIRKRKDELSRQLTGSVSLEDIGMEEISGFVKLVTGLGLDKLHASNFNGLTMDLACDLLKTIRITDISAHVLNSILAFALINIRQYWTLLSTKLENSQSIEPEETAITDKIINVSKTIYINREHYLQSQNLQQRGQEKKQSDHSREIKSTECTFTFRANELKTTLDHLICIKESLIKSDILFVMNQSIFFISMARWQSLSLIIKKETEFLPSLVALTKQGHLLGRAYSAWLLLNHREYYLPDIALNHLSVARNPTPYHFDNDMITFGHTFNSKGMLLDNVDDDLASIELFLIALYEYDNPSKSSTIHEKIRQDRVRGLSKGRNFLPVDASNLLTYGYDKTLKNISANNKADSKRLWLKGWIYQQIGEYDEAITCFNLIRKGSHNSQNPSHVNVNLGLCYYHQAVSGNDDFLSLAQQHLTLAIAYYQDKRIFTEEYLPTLECSLKEIKSIMIDKGIAEKNGDSAPPLTDTTLQAVTEYKNPKVKKNREPSKIIRTSQTGPSTNNANKLAGGEKIFADGASPRSSAVQPDITMISETIMRSDVISFENILARVNKILKTHIASYTPSKKSEQIDILKPEWQVKLHGKKKSVSVIERSNYQNFNFRIYALDSYLLNLCVTNDFHQYSRALFDFLENADLKYTNNIELLFDRLGWLLLKNCWIICHNSNVSQKELNYTVISLFMLSIAYTVSSDSSVIIVNDQEVPTCVEKILIEVREYLNAIEGDKNIYYQAGIRLVSRLSNLAHSLNDFQCYPVPHSGVITLRNSLQPGIEKIKKNNRSPDAMIASIERYTPKIAEQKEQKEQKEEQKGHP